MSKRVLASGLDGGAADVVLEMILIAVAVLFATVVSIVMTAVHEFEDDGVGEFLVLGVRDRRWEEG
jgi:ABC-type Na+ efflux pump permease subunit